MSSCLDIVRLLPRHAYERRACLLITVHDTQCYMRTFTFELPALAWAGLARKPSLPLLTLPLRVTGELAGLGCNDARLRLCHTHIAGTAYTNIRYVSPHILQCMLVTDSGSETLL